MNKHKHLWEVFFLCWISLPTLMAQGEQLFDDSYVHEIRINSNSTNLLADLEAIYDPFPPNGNVYLPVSVNIDGTILNSVGMRIKGFSSVNTPTDKKPFKLDFNEFVSGQGYDGLKKVNLNNGYADPAIQREVLAYNIMRASGINAPRTAYTKVYLNDEFWGVYVIVEQVDKTFIEQNFGDSSGGSLFKATQGANLSDQGPDSSAYFFSYDLKSNALDGGTYTTLVNFIDFINNSSDVDFQAEIMNYIDLENYFKVLAVDVAINNWDSYFKGNNYYLYFNPSTQKFNWIPWDYNFSMEGKFSYFGDYPLHVNDCPSVVNGSSPYNSDDFIFMEVINENSACCQDWTEDCQTAYDAIVAEPSLHTFEEDYPVDIRNHPFDIPPVFIQRILQFPQFQEMYYAQFCKLLDDNFTTERLFPLIDQYGDLIRNDVYNETKYLHFTRFSGYDAPEYDPYSFDLFENDLNQGHPSLPGLKRFIQVKTQLLPVELEALFNCPDFTSPYNSGDIVINEFTASNNELSGIADQDGEYEDWIELYNNTNSSIDLSEFHLTDNPDSPEKWTFPQGTTIDAGGYLIIWADNDLDEDGLHANFKLSVNGEFLMLKHFDVVLDSLTFGVQETNVAAARVPNGTGNFIFQSNTFNANNDNAVESCSDGIQNQNEIGIDCGDSCLPCNIFNVQDVVINEFMASNDSLSGLADNAGEYDDWIELYNNTNTTIGLSGFYLTDDITDPMKWLIPQGNTIAPNSYLILWADDDGSQGDLHTNFKLSAGGEFIMLSYFSTVIDSISYGQQQTNIAAARVPNGIGDFVLQAATFNANNGGGSMPTCEDGIQNGDETGVDCGGDCPPCTTPTCEDGIQNGDETGVDCGGSCSPCINPPTCEDGIQNGDETGVDCGGDCSPCINPPTCEDGIQNGDETGIDCGGDCPPCTTPTCEDGIQNGDETGVDCGGSCSPCINPPTCEDGIQNGDETGVDCGGSCPPCTSNGNCDDIDILTQAGQITINGLTAPVEIVQVFDEDWELAFPLFWNGVWSKSNHG